jgi:hypothetical protein
LPKKKREEDEIVTGADGTVMSERYSTSITEFKDLYR